MSTLTFYREAESSGKPVIHLLHGYPTSSYKYRDLMCELGNEYHLIAPDKPGLAVRRYCLAASLPILFENLYTVLNGFVEKLGLKRYTLYIMDYVHRLAFVLPA